MPPCRRAGDYETFFVDRQAPSPVVTVGTGCCGSEAGSPIDSHKGPGPLNAFWIMADFGEPVNGLYSSEIRIIGGAPNGGWGFRHYNGDTSYGLSVYPTGTGDMVIEVPARVAEDRAGNPNRASNRVVLPFRGAAFGLETPPNRTFTADHPVSGFTLPAASGGSGSFTYALAPRGGGSLPSGLSFSSVHPHDFGHADDGIGRSDAGLHRDRRQRRVAHGELQGRGQRGAGHWPSRRTGPSSRTGRSGGSGCPMRPAARGNCATSCRACPGTSAGAAAPGSAARTRTPGVFTVTWKVTDANGATLSRTFTITVAEPGPGVTFSRRALSVPEGGEATFTVRLNTQPSANVTVRIPSASGDTDIFYDPIQLIFTPANWSARQTFTVSANEDADSANGSRTIFFEVVSDDDDYDGLTVPSLVATEVDNDDAALFWSAEMTVGQGSGHVGYCEGSCSRYYSDDPNSGFGSLSDGTDNAFAEPSVSGGSVAVTALSWPPGGFSDVVGAGDLILRMAPFPAASVYNAWYLTRGRNHEGLFQQQWRHPQRHAALQRLLRQRDPTDQ